MRAMWKGSIAFGLVNVPVKLYSATETHDVRLHQVHDEDGGRIFIKALRPISAGEELNYDYGLIIEERYTKKLKAEYPCWCGAEGCRGTLLAPKRGRR